MILMVIENFDTIYILKFVQEHRICTVILNNCANCGLIHFT